MEGRLLATREMPASSIPQYRSVVISSESRSEISSQVVWERSWEGGAYRQHRLVE